MNDFELIHHNNDNDMCQSNHESFTSRGYYILCEKPQKKNHHRFLEDESKSLQNKNLTTKMYEKLRIYCLMRDTRRADD